ncbi:MAG: proline/glycine betaine ABC transporter permease, partial [Halorhodospira sp.]
MDDDTPELEDHETIGPLDRTAEWFSENILDNITIGDWIEGGVDWISANLDPLLQAIEGTIGGLVDATEFLLLYPLWLVALFLIIGIWHSRGRNAGLITAGVSVAVFGLGLLSETVQALFWFPPPWVLALLLILVSFWRVGWRFGIFSVIALALIFSMELWPETIRTLSLVVASSIAALIIGLPIGVAMSRSDRVEMLVRPVLDLMQTMPPFVYLIPAAIFFGLGT